MGEMNYLKNKMNIEMNATPTPVRCAYEVVPARPAGQGPQVQVRPTKETISQMVVVLCFLLPTSLASSPTRDGGYQFACGAAAGRSPYAHAVSSTTDRQTFVCLGLPGAPVALGPPPVMRT